MPFKRPLIFLQRAKWEGVELRDRKATKGTRVLLEAS